MSREKDRLMFEKKVELSRAYGLIKGILSGIKLCDDFNKAGLIFSLEEVESILAKHLNIKNEH